MAIVKYLLANEQDLEWGLYVKTVGMQEVPAGSAYPPAGHPEDHLFQPDGGRILQDTHILYIINGSGWFASAHQPRTCLQAGDAVLLFPGEWHSYAPNPRTGWSEAWIGFSGNRAKALVELYGFGTEKPVVHVGVSNNLYVAFDQACQVALKQLPAFQQQLSGYVVLLISSIYAMSRQQEFVHNPSSESIVHALLFMRQNLYRPLHMEEVAQAIGMGYSKFRKLFRDYTGFPPTQYFLRLKMEQAKDYLLSTSLSGKEIAFRLGFDSVSYFIKLFRQYHGQTPSEVRWQFGRQRN